MKMDLIHTIENSVISGKFVTDNGLKEDFDGHLDIEVSGDTIGVADVYNVMTDLNADKVVVKFKTSKSFRVSFIRKADVQPIFNGVVSLFEDIYVNS